MIDPMAGLDGGAPGVNTDEKDVIDFTSLRYNMERVDTIRSVMGIASGCAAGILGLTGLEGFGTNQVLKLEKFVKLDGCHFFSLVSLSCYRFLRGIAHPRSDPHLWLEDAV